MRTWLARILLISSAICLAACSQPVGTLYSSNTNGSENSMFIVARQYIYQLDARYDRYNDFNIYVVENGNIITIATRYRGEVSGETIGVKMIYNSNSGSARTEVELSTANTVQLYTVGTVVIEVTLPAELGYFEQDGITPRSAQYSIEVFSPNNGNGGGGDGGIGIIWNE